MRNLFRVLSICLILAGALFCPMTTEAGLGSAVTKIAGKAVKSLKNGKSFMASEDGSKVVRAAGFHTSRYLRNRNKDRVDQDDNTTRDNYSSRVKDDGPSLWSILLIVFAATLIFIVCPYLLIRWLYRCWKRWTERHQNDSWGVALRMLKKKPVWITLLVFIVILCIYI